MNIFVGGIHGVGKTYLASRAAPDAGLFHTSASKLIKEERTLSTWANDKRVTDVDANQRALAAAIRRHNDAGTRILLDGHFVLLGESGDFIHLATAVFDALNLRGVLLVETDPQIVAKRIAERDQRQVSNEHLSAFMKAEREQAHKVCAELNIPLSRLISPSQAEFSASIYKIDMCNY